jgi:hypothetical protein
LHQDFQDLRSKTEISGGGQVSSDSPGLPSHVIDVVDVLEVVSDVVELSIAGVVDIRTAIDGILWKRGREGQ